MKIVSCWRNFSISHFCKSNSVLCEVDEENPLNISKIWKWIFYWSIMGNSQFMIIPWGWGWSQSPRLSPSLWSSRGIPLPAFQALNWNPETLLVCELCLLIFSLVLAHGKQSDFVEGMSELLAGWILTCVLPGAGSCMAFPRGRRFHIWLERWKESTSIFACINWFLQFFFSLFALGIQNGTP